MHHMTNAPEQHQHTPDRLSHQEARALGFTPNAWNSNHWIGHHRGLRTKLSEVERLQELTEGELYTNVDAERLAADLEYMHIATPGAILSHTSAWRFHGNPLPDFLAQDTRTYVSIPKTGPRIKRNTVVCVRRPHEPEYGMYGGIRVTRQAQTWLDLAKLTKSVEHLVMCGDYYVRNDARNIIELERAIERVKGVAGINRARRALEYIRHGAESLQESRVRYRMAKARLPEPQLQHVVRDQRGVFIARLDMGFTKQKVAVEYQGTHHYHDIEKIKKDEVRTRRLEAQGWKVLAINSNDLNDPMNSWIDDVRAAL